MDRLNCNSLPDVTYFALCQVESDKMRQFFQVRVILFCNSGPAGQMLNCDWAREVSLWIVSSFILCSSFFRVFACFCEASRILVRRVWKTRADFVCALVDDFGFWRIRFRA